MRVLSLFLVLVFSAVLTGRACDLCGCYTPQLATTAEASSAPLFSWAAGSYAAVSHQFTYFGTVQRNGNEVSNPTGQYLDSSITRLVADYEINSRFSLQVDVPLIYRAFKRPEDFAIDRGNVSGLGDVSLLLRAVVFHYSSPGRRTFDISDKNPVAIEHEPDFTASAVVIGGLKFPTGATSRLKEEFHETDIPGAPESGIHGHDLTVGTGSYDGIFGEQTALRYKNLFFETNVQFTLRGDGAHQYHFANDLTWNGGPGYYLARHRDTIIGIELVVSGEYKDVDRFRGATAIDTGITSVFIGPRLITSRGRWSAEIAGELPVSLDNTAFQIVPDYRLHGAISVHF
jgi:hypothetical protein